jgi:hypothetical protein
MRTRFAIIAKIAGETNSGSASVNSAISNIPPLVAARHTIDLFWFGGVRNLSFTFALRDSPF